MKREYACTECMHYGEFEDWLELSECPECGAPLEIVPHEFMPIEKSYNWNKK